MSRCSARHSATALLFFLLLLTTVFAFGSDAKTSAAKKPVGHAAAKSSAKRSKSKRTLTPEQREKIAEELQERRQAHDHPGQAEKFYLSRRLPKGQKRLPVEKYLRAKDQMRTMRRYDSGLGRWLTPEEHQLNQQIQSSVLSGGA